MQMQKRAHQMQFRLKNFKVNVLFCSSGKLFGFFTDDKKYHTQPKKEP